MTSTHGDDFGHRGLTILDADTGTPVVEYGQATGCGQVTLGDREWKSNGVLLSPMNGANRYGLIRLDIAGGTEHAIEPGATWRLMVWLSHLNGLAESGT